MGCLDQVVKYNGVPLLGLLDMKRELFAQMGRGKIQSFTVQKGLQNGWAPGLLLEQVRPQAGEGLEAKQARSQARPQARPQAREGLEAKQARPQARPQAWPQAREGLEAKQAWPPAR